MVCKVCSKTWLGIRCKVFEDLAWYQVQGVRRHGLVSGAWYSCVWTRQSVLVYPCSRTGDGAYQSINLDDAVQSSCDEAIVPDSQGGGRDGGGGDGGQHLACAREHARARV